MFLAVAAEMSPIREDDDAHGRLLCPVSDTDGEIASTSGPVQRLHSYTAGKLLQRQVPRLVDGAEAAVIASMLGTLRLASPSPTHSGDLAGAHDKHKPPVHRRRGRKDERR